MPRKLDNIAQVYKTSVRLHQESIHRSLNLNSRPSSPVGHKTYVWFVVGEAISDSLVSKYIFYASVFLIRIFTFWQVLEKSFESLLFFVSTRNYFLANQIYSIINLINLMIQYRDLSFCRICTICTILTSMYSMYIWKLWEGHPYSIQLKWRSGLSRSCQNLNLTNFWSIHHSAIKSTRV